MEKFIKQMKPDELTFNTQKSNDSSDGEVLNELKNAHKNNKTLTGYCTRCLEDGTLEIKLGDRITGYIARNEVTPEIEKDGLVHLGKCQRKVGLYVSFKVKNIKTEDNGEISATLSRKDAIEEVREIYRTDLKVNHIVEGVVIGMQDYAAWIDIGGDVNGILSIRDITRVPIVHPSDVLKIGQTVSVVVTEKEQKEDGTLKVSFSRKELLPSFDDIDKYFTQGTTVPGKIKKMWDTGIFIELSEAYEGLAEFLPGKKFNYGDKVRVKIELIDKKRKKIKLRIID